MLENQLMYTLDSHVLILSLTNFLGESTGYPFYGFVERDGNLGSAIDKVFF